MNNIEIFDLDGTLTEEFSPTLGDKTGFGLNTYALWNLITRDLVADKKEFDQKAIAWRKMVTSTPNIDKVSSSKDMTEIGVKLLKEEYKNAVAIKEKAAAITEMFLDKGIVIIPAIKYLEHRLQHETTCVISTGGYEDGAIGFFEGLVKHGLLNKSLSKKIIFSGTKVDWKNLTVTHANIDTHKLLGLEQALEMSLAKIKPDVFAAFGDDPAVNDRSLLELGKYNFAIRTHKNTNATLPPNCVFADWQEIFANKDNLGFLHSAFQQKVFQF